MTKQEQTEARSLMEAQLDAIGLAEHVEHGDWTERGNAARADLASTTLAMVNDTIRRTLAHHEAGKPTETDHAAPYDRLSCLYDARQQVLNFF